MADKEESSTATATPVTTAPMTMDMSQWAEPKETFIGRLVKCDFSDTDQAKNRDGLTFTELRNIPRAIKTWVTEVERLDAVFVNKDTGEKSPVKRFMSVDLERFDDRDKKFHPVTQGNGKAAFLAERWNKVIKLGSNPSVFEGAIFEFELLRSKSFGGPQPAKNLMYPLRQLANVARAASYQYHGDVMEIEFTPKGDEQSLEDAAEAVQAQAQQTRGQPTLGEDEVLKLVAEAGLDPENDDALTAFVTAHKAALPSSVKQGIVTGEWVPAQLEAGKLVVVEGVLALPSE